MSDSQPAHVKVTINDLYKEQQETNKLLIQLATELKSLSDLPARVSKLEIVSAERAWIPRLLWGAVSAGFVGFVTAVYSIVRS
jgi:hypothetical protein